MRPASRVPRRGSMRKNCRVGKNTYMPPGDTGSSCVVRRSVPFLCKCGSRNGHLIFDASGHGKPHAIVHGIAAGICFTVSLHWFFNIWVIRKALIKALGMGVVVGMSRFEIPGSCAGV